MRCKRLPLTTTVNQLQQKYERRARRRSRKFFWKKSGNGWQWIRPIGPIGSDAVGDDGDDGAHIRFRSRGKTPAHVLEALRAAKLEIVALLRWRFLYAKREREHIRSFEINSRTATMTACASASRTSKRSSREGGRGYANTRGLKPASTC
jgi:hypothetical protein